MQDCNYRKPMVVEGRELFICTHDKKGFVFCNNNLNYGKCPLEVVKNDNR